MTRRKRTMRRKRKGGGKEDWKDSRRQRKTKISGEIASKKRRGRRQS
jgi:hypothetical protein